MNSANFKPLMVTQRLLLNFYLLLPIAPHLSATTTEFSYSCDPQMSPATHLILVTGNLPPFSSLNQRLTTTPLNNTEALIKHD